MNERLKALIARGGMNPAKVQALLDMFGGDAAWVEEILRNADVAQKAALSEGVAFKTTPVVAEKWTGMGDPPHLNDQKKKKPKKPNYDPATDPMAVMNGADQLKGNRR